MGGDLSFAELCFDPSPISPNFSLFLHFLLLFAVTLLITNKKYASNRFCLQSFMLIPIVVSEFFPDKKMWAADWWTDIQTDKQTKGQSSFYMKNA